MTMERLEIQERKGGIMDCWMSMPENMIMGVMTAGTARTKQRADEQGGEEEGRRMGQTRTAFERSELHRCEREERRGGEGQVDVLSARPMKGLAEKDERKRPTATDA